MHAEIRCDGVDLMHRSALLCFCWTPGTVAMPLASLTGMPPEIRGRSWAIISTAGLFIAAIFSSGYTAYLPFGVSLRRIWGGFLGLQRPRSPESAVQLSQAAAAACWLAHEPLGPPQLTHWRTDITQPARAPVSNPAPSWEVGTWKRHSLVLSNLTYWS